MTTNCEAAPVPAALVQTWADLWAKYVEASTDYTKVLLESASGDGPADLESLRRRWLDALGKGMDAYLRTPAFLELLHRQFDAMTLAKGTADDVAKEVARNIGFPHLDDVAGLFERLQIGQEAIQARLTAIDRRLDALEGKKPNGHRKTHNSH
jgi:hypothetical protein